MKQKSKSLVEELVSSMQASNQNSSGFPVNKEAVSLAENRKKKHGRLSTFLAAAAAVAAFCTTYALILPAITLDQRPEFGMSPLNQTDPSLTASSTASAPATTKGMVDVKLSGVYADDLVAVAETQVGTTESTDNFFVNANGESKGYTPYGAWYGDTYADWSASFVSFCLNNAGIASEVVPYEADPAAWIEKLKDPNLDLYKSVANYTPVKGDLVFLKKGETDKTANSVAIITTVELAADNTFSQIEVIEGDVENTVKKLTYTKDDTQIVGFAALPVSPVAAPLAASDPGQPNTASNPASGASTPEKGSLEYWQDLFTKAGAEEYLDTLDEQTVADYNQDPDFANKTDEERIAQIKEMLLGGAAQALNDPATPGNPGIVTKAGDPATGGTTNDPGAGTTATSDKIYWKVEDVVQSDGSKVKTLKLRNDSPEGAGYTELNISATQPFSSKGSIKEIVIENPIKRGDHLFTFEGFTSVSKLTGFENFDVTNSSLANMFKNCANGLSGISELAKWDTTGVTDMSSMFAGCIKLVDTTPLSEWNTSSVKNMEWMFFGGYKDIWWYYGAPMDLSGLAKWDVSNVVDMSNMFKANRTTDYSALMNWDVSSLKNTSYMFSESSITNLTDLSNWRPLALEDMSWMFYSAKSLSSCAGLEGWRTPALTTMESAFQESVLTDTAPLLQWDVSSVTNMANLFYKAELTEVTGLANWDVSSVTNMSNVFYKAKLTNVTGLANWDVSSVTTMSGMFRDNKSLTDISPLAGWAGKTRSLTDMSFMFSYAGVSVLAPLGGWDVSNVTTLENTFEKGVSLAVTAYDTNELSGWNVSNVTNMKRTFAGGVYTKPHNLEGLRGWDVSSVTTMSGMFDAGATAFYNRYNYYFDLSPISGWDVSNVTDMSSMFRGQLFKANGLSPLAGWGSKTGSVTNMSSMFYEARSSDLNGLETWDVSNVTNMSNMFGTLYGSNGWLKDISALSTWQTTSLRNISGIFHNIRSLKDISPLANWDTSSVSNMNKAFWYCTGLTNLDALANWDTSSVTNFGQMFWLCTSLTDATGLKNWDTSQATSIGDMFAQCYKLQYADMTNWNLDKVASWTSYGNNNIFSQCTNIQRVVSQKTSPGDMNSPVLPLMNIEGTVMYNSIPQGNITLVQFDNSLFNDLSDCMVRLTKTVNGKDVNIPTFGFKVFNEAGNPVAADGREIGPDGKDEDGNPVDQLIVYNDHNGIIKIDAEPFPAGKYYVQEITSKEEIDKDPLLTYYPGMQYDTSKKWFEKIDAGNELRKALEDPTNTISVSQFFMTIRNANGDVVFQTTIRCAWKGRSYPNGTVNKTRIMVFGNEQDMINEGRDYDAEINSVREGNANYKAADHDGIPLWKAVRYLMCYSAPKQLQHDIWALFHQGTFNYDPQLMEQIPHDFVYAIAQAPSTGQQPLAIKLTGLSGTVKVTDVNFNNTTSPIEIKIIKKDQEDKPLSGATLAIFSTRGEKLDEWVSTAEPHVFNPNLPGTFVLREISPPKGYQRCEDTVFTIDDKGVITKEGTNESIVIENDTISVINEKYPLEVIVIKQDGNGNPLPGATLALFDKSNKEVERWVTEANPHVCYPLTPGEYTIKELIPPKGYGYAEDIVVTIDADGTVKQNKVIIENKTTTMVEPEEWEFEITKAGKDITKPYAFLSGMEVKLTPLAYFNSPTDYAVDNEQEPLVVKITQENQKIKLKCDITYLFEEIKAPEGYGLWSAKLFLNNGRVVGQIGELPFAILYSADTLESGTISHKLTNEMAYLEVLNRNYKVERRFDEFSHLEAAIPKAIEGLKALVGDTTYVYSTTSGWVVWKGTDPAPTAPNTSPGARPLGILILDPHYLLPESGAGGIALLISLGAATIAAVGSFVLTGPLYRRAREGW